MVSVYDKHIRAECRAVLNATQQLQGSPSNKEQTEGENKQGWRLSVTRKLTARHDL